jgi:hypothetical protein
MKKTQLCAFLCLIVFLTGCPNEPSKDLNNKNSFAKSINTYLARAQGRYEETVKTDPNEAKRIRDDAIEDALAVIDSNYTDYISKLSMRRSTIDFVADVIELGAGAATGISKGERPNQILGISLTAFRGVRRSSELNFYKEQTVPILIAKMDDNRAQAHAVLLEKKLRQVSQYSFKEAIGDVVTYYNAGTLVRAFTQLSRDTAAQASLSEKRVLQLQNISSNDVIEMTPDTTSASIMIGKYRHNYFKALTQGSGEVKQETTEKLRLIYLDVAKGAKSEQFKPILEKLKKDNPSLKAETDKLEGNDDDSKSVAGEKILDILSLTFSTIDIQKQGNLIVMLKEIFDNRL